MTYTQSYVYFKEISMKKEHYAGQSVADLQKALHEKRTELGKLTFARKDRTQVQDTASIAKLRKSIARILTQLNAAK